jgi:CDP-glucose 4,6-dehydratase
MEDMEVMQMAENFWKLRDVFVTGASGIIGSWLTKELVDKGAQVTILMRDRVPKSYLNLSGYINKVNISHGSLDDYHAIERTLNEYEIKTVFHLAAQTIVGTANRSPLSTFESNIKGTWNLLEAARNSKLVEGVVVASSDKAYGEHDKLPYKEDFALKGKHPYDVSKSCTDLITQSYYHTYGLPVAIARCGNVYGGGDLNYNRIVPGTIRSLYLNENPIIRSDGTLVRDYIYVKDIVSAYMAITENLVKVSVKGEAFNFGNNEPKTVIEIVEVITKLMNKNLKPKILNEAKAEIKKQYLFSEKANRAFGWRPKYSLEAGLKETIPWYLDFFKNHIKI